MPDVVEKVGAPRVTTQQVIERLHSRHPMWKGQWACIVEFLRVDFLAVATWPSMHYDVHGYEIKVSRSDWLAELKQPHKAEAGMARCDYWWLAAAPGVVKSVDELPKNWGFLEVPALGPMRVVVDPPALRDRLAKRYVDKQLNPVHVDREAFAGMARRVAYAEADRRALLKLADMVDIGPALDAARILTGRSPKAPIVPTAEAGWERRKRGNSPSRIRRKNAYRSKRQRHEEAGW